MFSPHGVLHAFRYGAVPVGVNSYIHVAGSPPALYTTNPIKTVASTLWAGGVTLNFFQDGPGCVHLLVDCLLVRVRCWLHASSPVMHCCRHLFPSTSIML
jgi:hypothetical protein